MVSPTATNFIQDNRCKSCFINTNWVHNVIKCPDGEYQLNMIEPRVGLDRKVSFEYSSMYCDKDELARKGINLIA